MTREEKFDLLSRYLDDTLQEGDVQQVEDLLRTDPEFAAALADVSLQHSLLHRLGKTNEAAPAESGSGVHRVAPRRRAQARRLSGRMADASPWIRVALPLAAAILLVIAGVSLLPGTPVTPPAPIASVPAPDAAPPPPEPERVPPPPAVEPVTPKRAAPIATHSPKGKPPVTAPLPQPRTPRPVPPPIVPAPAPKPADKPALPATTRIALATLRDVSGPVWITDGAGIEKGPVVSGTILEGGQGIRTGAAARATVRYPDDSVLEIHAETELREFSAVKGKRAYLSKGMITAQVDRQARGAPLILTTPQADVQVLGTRFTVRLTPGITRLSVTEGRVRFTRRRDGRSVTVSAGFLSEAGGDRPLKPVPIRPAAGLVALYRFDEGRGTAVRDTSGNGAPLDLTIADAATVEWRAGSLVVLRPAVIRSARPAAKIAQACRQSNALTVEAWLRPAAARAPAFPEPGRIVTCSQDLYARNFCLEQGGPRGSGVTDVYNVRLRTSGTGANGFPPLFSTPAGTSRPRLTHVVFVRTAADLLFYVDGRELSRRASAGDLSSWDPSMPLILADEIGGKRPWIGEYHSLAIYSRALTAQDVTRLTATGPE